MTYAAFLLMLVSRPGFLGLYPSTCQDYIYTALETEAGYSCWGGTDHPSGSVCRYLYLDTNGNIIADSLLSCGGVAACTGPDSTPTAAESYPEHLLLKAVTPEGEVLWQREHAELAGLCPSELVHIEGTGYLFTGFSEDRTETYSTVALFTEPGDLLWNTVIPGSRSTAICLMTPSSIRASFITDTGSSLCDLSMDGEITAVHSFENMLIRDIAAMNGYTAAAAVDSGLRLYDSSGSLIWTGLSGSEREIYAVTPSGNNCFAAAGSVPVEGLNRSYLASISFEGIQGWERTYGYGESFRSIYLRRCSDGGFISAGGYVENGTFNSFLLRTDSLGYITPQGMENPGMQSFTIYCPSPQKAPGVFYTLSPCESVITLRLLDISGRVLGYHSLKGNGEERELYFPCANPGCYFITVENRENTATATVILTR